MKWRRLIGRGFPGLTLADRLEHLSMPEPNSGCVLWLGALNRGGYGLITIDGRSRRAHRIAYEVKYGGVPHGRYLCHRCDVRSCINTAHLFVGDHRSNMQDCAEKMRTAWGEKNGQSILTAAQVLAIRNDERMAPKVAAQFGVARATISDIRSGRTWANVPNFKAGKPNA